MNKSWNGYSPMRFMVRFLGFLFAAGTVVFLVGVAAAAGLIWHFSKDLPDYSQLQDYEPPVMTRVHAVDGSLVGEYARERRLYLPIQAVPKLVINAFLAAEDKNFYEHGGIDFTGMARAAVAYAQNFGSNRRPQGASTITQQVAKNFLLTNEVSFARKIKEALLAMRIERTYSKDKILELYLNEIYLGSGAYGIAAAFWSISTSRSTSSRWRRRLIWRPCRRCRAACIRFVTAIARSSAATTWSTACWRMAGSSRPMPIRPARIR